MYFSELLILMISAIIVIYFLMLLGEKLIITLSPGEVASVYKIVGSFLFAIATVVIVVNLFNLRIDFKFYLLAGGIILINKYWLGHFAKDKIRNESLSECKKKVVE